MDFRNEMKKLEGFTPEQVEEMEFLSNDTDNMLNLLFEHGAIQKWSRLNDNLVIEVNEELSWETATFEDKEDGIRQTHSFTLGLYTFMLNMAYQTEKEMERRKAEAEKAAKQPQIIIPGVSTQNALKL